MIYLRLQSQAASLSASGTMSGTLNVPNTVAPINISADLRAGRVLCFVEVGAPREGRPLTRINWLLRQLRDAPEDVRIDAFTPWSRGASRSELLRDLRQDPTLLLDDQKREIRKFQIAIGSVAGTKRGQGKGSFVGSVFELVDKFYGEVVQNLKPWSASPPRLRHPEPEDIAEIDVPPQLPSTALSSQDEQESEGVGIEQFAQQDDPGVDGERISDRRDDPVELFEGLYRSTETTKLNEEPDRAVAPAATQI